MKSSKNIAVLLAAGSGTRSGLAYNKIFYRLPGGATVLETAINTIKAAGIDEIVVVAAAADIAAVEACFKGPVVAGGLTRSRSVKNGLDFIAANGGAGLVVIHDCARPYARPELFSRAIESALLHGSGVAAVKTVDTVKEAENGKVTFSLPRQKLFNIQTPQAFDFETLYQAYDRGGEETDDSEVFLKAGHEVYLCEGGYDNVKLTNREDFTRYRSGTGFDVHRLVTGRPLVLGGIDIPFDKGLEGHSDADVLTHAIMDALLSAAGLKDIGTYFPDSDESYRNIDSLLLLAKTDTLIQNAGWRVINISAAVMAEKPRLAPYIDAMRTKLAETLKLNTDAVGISATTTEKLGIIGEERGMAATAVCLLASL